MKAPADKSPEPQRQAAAHEAPQQQNRSDAELQFVDNRAETASLRQLQETVDNSPRRQGLAQLKAMMSSSPRSDAIRSLQAMVDNSPRRASMRLRAGSDDVTVQRVEDEELIQGKFVGTTAPVQRQEAAAPAINETGLPDNLKAGIEFLSGMDMSDVQVHKNSSKPAELNALAYAQGSDIHLGAGQEQHLPHEAWHVVQQRQGWVKPTVQMAGQQVNDDAALESEADVMGAKALGAAGGAAQRVEGDGTLSKREGHFLDSVQRKMVFLSDTDYLNIDGAGAGIALAGYQGTLREAISMSSTITVRADVPAVGTAVYKPNPLELSGDITISPIEASDIHSRTEGYNSRLIAMAHETRHGVDDLTKTVRFRNNNDNKIRTEWRAFATQSAVAWQLCNEGRPVEQRYQLDIASYASRQAFMHASSRMVGTTQSYMILYKMNANPSMQGVQDFMMLHVDWVDDAIQLFNSLKPAHIPMQAAQQLRPGGVDESGWIGMLKTAGWVVGAVATAYVIKALVDYYGLPA